MTQSSVKIQCSPESVPSTPSWFGEVAVVAQVLTQTGLLQRLQKEVRFARAHFGMYEVIDFLALLIGYTLSGEPTLLAFFERLTPFADAFMALFGRKNLPHRSTLSRFLAAVPASVVETLRQIVAQEVVARGKQASPGGLWDRCGQPWLVVDVDGTKAAARQRALPHGPDLPEPTRRFEQVAAKGYLGRKRGEVARTRTTILQAHTHQWLGTFSGAGNGDYREELKRAAEVIITYASAILFPTERIVVRLDGLYGNAAPVLDVLSWNLGCIMRGKDSHLLDLPQVQTRLQAPPDATVTHPETGMTRTLFDCPAMALAAGGHSVRMIVATHPATTTPAPVGTTRDGVVYELFFTTLPQSAFTASDVLCLYLHRGSFETVLTDEDQEQDPDRWVSHTPCGQELWQVICQWMWNVRLELGAQLSPAAMRWTEFASALPTPALSASEPLLAETPPMPVTYGPPKFARPSFTGGFAGEAFPLQPDGTLRCPANRPLYPQERRPERDGSYRLLYAARIGDCRVCHLRAQCQESPSSRKPRRVSAVFWPLASQETPSTMAPLPTRQAVSPQVPLLWGDWPRCQLRRSWLKIIRSQTITMRRGMPTEELALSPRDSLITRSQRAHWRLRWEERLARNACSATASLLTITLHGLPASFAHAFGLHCLHQV
jgi:hypothetical protein